MRIGLRRFGHQISDRVPFRTAESVDCAILTPRTLPPSWLKRLEMAVGLFLETFTLNSEESVGFPNLGKVPPLAK